MDTKKEASLYIHIPFCIKKCNYCDFLSFPASEEVKQSYVDYLCRELERNSRTFASRKIVSVFLGGGTPSCLPGEWILRIMETVYKCYDVLPCAEITIEMNPGTVDREKLLSFQKAGINRLSIGLQSTNDGMLKKLGRIHDYNQFIILYRMAREMGFTNISVDLMSGLPGQKMDDFKDTLKKVVALSPEHLSCYSLILEEGTFFYENQASMSFPDEDEDRQMYAMTGEFLREHGYHRYEISNYAKPGRESLHNSGYWNGREYMGIGLGASSCVSGVRFRNPSELPIYIEMLSKDEDIVLPPSEMSPYFEEVQVLSLEDQMEEFMFLGLRMMQGVDEDEFLRRFGRCFDEIYGETAKKLLDEQLIIKEKKRIMLTERGIDLSNYVFTHFLF